MILNKARAKHLVRSFWQKACLYDGISTDSIFVVFSNDNPYAAALNRANILYFALA
jgi:hypothetical protein